MNIFDAHKNFAYSLVEVPPTPDTSGNTLTVRDGEGALFPQAPFNAVVWPENVDPTVENAEIIRVISVSVDTFTFIRVREDSQPIAILEGYQIANNITNKFFTDIESFIETNYHERGINYYHEGMAFISRTSDQIDADLLDMIKHGLTDLRVITNPMGVSTQAELIIRRAKKLGLTVLTGANLDSPGTTVQDSGTVSSATSTTLTDNAKSWVTNEWVGFQVYILTGLGSPAAGYITANTPTTLTISAVEGFATFSTVPDGTSTYKIAFEKVAQKPFQRPVTGYAAMVQAQAQRFLDAGADYYDVGNELQTHMSNQEPTYFSNALLPSRMKELITQVEANTNWNIEDLGYAAEFHTVGVWRDAGLGLMGHIGFNFYGDILGFQTDSLDALNSFGGKRVWVTEWSTESTFGSLAVTEAEWTKQLNQRRKWLENKGFGKTYAFAYRETTDNGFGYLKSVGTGGYHEAWPNSFGINIDSDILDHSLYFNGNNSKVTVPTNVKFNEAVTALTVEAWINSRGRTSPNTQTIVKKDGQFILRLNGGGKLQGIVWTSVSGQVSFQDPAYITEKTPLHVALTYDGTNLSVFINGNRVGQAAATGNIVATTQSVLLGWATSEAFKGAINHIRISKSVRYSGATYTIPTAKFVPDSNTLALYDMAEGEGNILKDSSGNGLHGSLGAGNESPAWYMGHFDIISSFGSVNNQLSNLFQTAINESLLPANDASIDLGSTTKRWRGIYLNRLLSSQATIPTIAIGAAAGTGAAPTLAQPTDMKGTITVNVVGGTATGVLSTVTFNLPYAVAPKVFLQPANAAAAGLSTQSPFVSSTTTTFSLNANGIALPDGAYQFNYLVVQ